MTAHCTRQGGGPAAAAARDLPAGPARRRGELAPLPRLPSFRPSSDLAVPTSPDPPGHHPLASLLRTAAPSAPHDYRTPVAQAATRPRARQMATTNAGPWPET